ncbi:MAG: MotA/TolQ/ExbB proton channel family protein [Candidatus Omnitrophica bacterium]|nr:MotA/TolQ/ExbB proton channel family protein [Candidatus Omnitrophota bacterium]
MRVRWDADLRAIISLMRAGKEKLARERAVPLGEPAGPVLLTGIDWAGESEERTEEQMLSEVMKRIPRLERGLALLSVTAAVAPLLGLLGTVTGMIHTFNLVTIFGAGKAQLLSSGISEALITTEFGLIVAVPALLAHAFLSRRVRQLIMRLEQLCHEFSSAIHFGERSVLVPGSRQWPDS